MLSQVNDGTGIHILVTIRINLPSKNNRLLLAGEKKKRDAKGPLRPANDFLPWPLITFLSE